MGVLGSIPGDAFAGLIPSHGGGKAGSRDEDLRSMQSFLERDLVREMLKSYGVPDQVAMDKVKEMSDEDLHRLEAMASMCACRLQGRACGSALSIYANGKRGFIALPRVGGGG